MVVPNKSSAGLWESIRFPSGHVYEDVYTIYRVIDRCEKVSILNESLYFYRKRRGSIVDDRSKSNVFDSILANSRWEDYVRKNTPDIFTLNQLARVRVSGVKGMIVYFSRFSGETNLEEVARCEELRQRSLSVIEEVGKRECGFRLRVCYWLLLKCPRLLRITYPLYHFFHQLKKYVL